MAVAVKHGSTPTIEIIELIDDDTDWQHPAPQPTPVEEGSRWVAVIVTTALLGAVAYGVISSAIAANDAKNQPVPTTIAPPTSSVSPTSQPAPYVTPRFYVADAVPAGFTMHFAETLGMGGNTADFVDSSSAELWATRGASATTGSWFVVSRGTRHVTGLNAYRTVVSGVVVVVQHDAESGQSRLAFTKGGVRLEISAFGWADRQLLRLAHSVYFADNEIRYDDHFFSADHEKLLDADPSTAIYGLPVAWVGYTTAVPAGLAQNFSITVSADPGDDQRVARRFALTSPGELVTSDGWTAHFGKLATDPKTTVVQWRDGDRLITLRGNIDPQQLKQIAFGVHAGDASTVRDQVDPDPPAVVRTNSEPRPVSSGWLDGPWIAKVSAAADGAEWLVWWIGQPGASGTPMQNQVRVSGAGPSIETFVNRGKTYVLARVPGSMGGAQLRVNRNGLPTVEVDFVAVGDDLSDEFAAYAFTEAVPFTARIVSAGGTAALWP